MLPDGCLYCSCGKIVGRGAHFVWVSCDDGREVSETVNLERAALIAEVLGGVAVVVSVVYLTIQISDNNRLLRSQAHFNVVEISQRPFDIMLESDTLAELLHRCKTDPYEVEEPVWSRCLNYYFMQANGWEYTYYQNLDNAVPPELWQGLDGYMSNEARSNRGWVRFWEETAIGFGEPFRSYIDGHIRQNPANANTQE